MRMRWRRWCRAVKLNQAVNQKFIGYREILRHYVALAKPDQLRLETGNFLGEDGVVT
jgi:hypothetical protein